MCHHMTVGTAITRNYNYLGYFHSALFSLKWCSYYTCSYCGYQYNGGYHDDLD